MNRFAKASKFFIACALPVALSACGKGSNTNPVDNMREANNAPELQEKIFKGECSLKPLEAIVSGIMTGGDTAIKSAREQYQFVGANVTHVTNLYTTTDCTGAESLIFKEAGSFEVDTKTKTPEGGTSINLEYKNLTVLPNNEDGVKVAQSSKLCGLQDWALGKDRDVTQEASRVSCYRQAVPSKDATVYQVIEDHTLVFGAKPKRSEVRPTSLDVNTKYVAQ